MIEITISANDVWFPALNWAGISRSLNKKNWNRKKAGKIKGNSIFQVQKNNANFWTEFKCCTENEKIETKTIER